MLTRTVCFLIVMTKNSFKSEVYIWASSFIKFCPWSHGTMDLGRTSCWPECVVKTILLLVVDKKQRKRKELEIDV